MPRDPNTEEHMDRMLSLVKAHWKKYPHQRLGQLISNAATMGWETNIDIFYIDDITLERNIIEELGK